MSVLFDRKSALTAAMKWRDLLFLLCFFFFYFFFFPPKFSLGKFSVTIGGIVLKVGDMIDTDMKFFKRVSKLKMVDSKDPPGAC